MEYQQIRKAIQSLPVPTNITEVRGFLGMINQLSKFSPNLAERSKPIFIINNGTGDQTKTEHLKTSRKS